MLQNYTIVVTLCVKVEVPRLNVALMVNYLWRELFFQKERDRAKAIFS
jgi:hypothetical protein